MKIEVYFKTGKTFINILMYADHLRYLLIPRAIT